VQDAGSNSAIKSMTVSFAELGFLAQVATENRTPLWKDMSSAERRDAPTPWGPANPQALNRYSYVQNNPLKYTDPSGHTIYMSKEDAKIYSTMLKSLVAGLRKASSIVEFTRLVYQLAEAIRQYPALSAAGAALLAGAAKLVAILIIAGVAGELLEWFFNTWADQLESFVGALDAAIEAADASGIYIAAGCGSSECGVWVGARNGSASFATDVFGPAMYFLGDPVRLRPGRACTLQGATPDGSGFFYLDSKGCSS
jgi:hypothetical protein